MEPWIELLFRNWIGILSLATVLGPFATVAFILVLLRKSHAK